MPSGCVVSSSGDKISSTWVSAVAPVGPPTGHVAPPPLPQPELNGSEDSDSKDSSGKNDLSQSEAEGVWAPDIEQSFREALAIYPPCGRRKIILSECGKMYGRNELIARYIRLRTGKNRTRKQVSSHIQVLARRRAREIQTKLKDQAAKEKALQSLTSLSSAQIVSATEIHNKAAAAGLASLVSPVNYPRTFWQPGITQPGTSEDIKPFDNSQSYGISHKPPVTAASSDLLTSASIPTYEGRAICTHKIRLVQLSAYMEKQRDPENYSKHLFIHIGDSSSSYSDPLLEAVDIRQIYDKFPEKSGGLKELFEKGPETAFFLVKFWADLNTIIEDEPGAFYGVNSEFESSENMTITCSTKVCSFGKLVVEKVETEYAHFENGRFFYRINRSPMCLYMVNFIKKLKSLPESYMQNSVLEHFSILLVVSNRDTQETLLCIAYVFEVSTSEPQHHIYRLIKD